MSRKELLQTTLTGVLAICAILVTVLVARRELMPPNTTGSEGPKLELVDVKDWSRLWNAGRQLNAPTSGAIELLIFTDFQCPACRSFSRRALTGAMEAFGPSLSVRIRHLPLEYHEFAYPAARTAECVVPTGRLHALHDIFFAKQDSLGKKSMMSFLVESGVNDTAGIAVCMSSAIPVPKIEADLADAKLVGARGTPTILLQGQLLNDVPDSTRLDSLIRAKLRRKR